MTGDDRDDPASWLADLPRLASIAEVAVLFGRNKRTIRRWIAGGLLPSVEVGGSVFVREDDLKTVLSGRLTKGILAGR